jgi:hypothetical protein
MKLSELECEAKVYGKRIRQLRSAGKNGLAGTYVKKFKAKQEEIMFKRNRSYNS